MQTVHPPPPARNVGRRQALGLVNRSERVWGQVRLGGDRVAHVRLTKAEARRMLRALPAGTAVAAELLAGVLYVG